MIKRARKDYENATFDPDEGNYYEFLPLWYRFRHWDGWYTGKRAIKHLSLLELRWYRHLWYRHSPNSPRNKKPGHVS